MTADQFRKLVLSFEGAEELAHHGHPDFRVNGRIFCTLGYPNDTRAMVKLTPEQQAEFVHDYPEVFSPCAGKWGEQGATSIELPKARKGVIQRALEAARQNAQCAALAATRRPRPAPQTESSKASRRRVRTVTARKKAAP